MIPIFLLGAARAVGAWSRASSARRRRAGSGKPSGPAGRAAPPPKLAVPVAAPCSIGGLLLVLPELALPGRHRALGGRRAHRRVRGRLRARPCRASRSPRSPSTARATRRSARRSASRAGRCGSRSRSSPRSPRCNRSASRSRRCSPRSASARWRWRSRCRTRSRTSSPGIYLLADRPVGAGDYIKIHDGEEGYVETIGWRSSRLRTTTGSVVIVPNQKLSQAILTNFHRPTSAVVDDRRASPSPPTPTSTRSRGAAPRRARPRGRRGRRARATPSRSSGWSTSPTSGQVWNCIVEVPGLRGAGARRARAAQAPPRAAAARAGSRLAVPERLLFKETTRTPK